MDSTNRKKMNLHSDKYMKKLIFGLSALLVAVGCAKVNNSPEPDRVDVEFSICGSQTKAVSVSADDEVFVDSIQVFVFNPDGSLDAMSAKTEGNNIILSCGVGDKTVAVIANGVEVEGTPTFEGLQSTVSDLNENKLGQFVMFGTLTQTLKARSTVTVPVRRLVSKIVIKEFYRQYDEQNAEDADLGMRITGIFLKHVAGDFAYGGNYNPTVWYNDVQNEVIEEPENIVALTTDYGVDSGNIADKESYTQEHVFYAYPNNYEITGKQTILSVRTQIEGVTEPRYYPIPLPALEPNKIYVLSKLTVTRPGGTFDDEDTIVFRFEVMDWEVGLEGQEIEY